MATAPQPVAGNGPVKAKRKSGPRSVKPIQGIMLYKGNLEGDFQIVFDPMEALDRKEADPNLQLKKFTVPRKSKPKSDAPTV